MLSTRWYKILRDLWGNRGRTILAVLSIAVGVFAVGMIAGADEMMDREMTASWQSANPADALIACQSFDEGLLRSVRNMPEVAEAQGSLSFGVDFQVANEEPRRLQLKAYPNFDDIRVFRLRHESGAWPPGDNKVLIERASLEWMGVEVGDSITIETREGRKRELLVTGVVYDVASISASWENRAAGYISFDTVERLGMGRDMDELTVVAERGASGAYDKDAVKSTVEAVRDRIERSGRTVWGTYIFPEGKHPADETVQPMMMIMGVMGVISLATSGFLVMNTIQALLTQQMRQIGIMKAIGGRWGQIVVLYLTMVLIFGLLSLLIAVPLGAVAARAMVGYITGIINSEIVDGSVSLRVIGIEVIVGLVVPMVAAMWPILKGVRVSAHQAMTEVGLGNSRFGRGLVDRALGKVRGVGRPTLLALRNTVRNKGRLMFTVITLVLASATFVGVFSVRSSLMRTFDTWFDYLDYDVYVSFNRGYRLEQLEREALAVPGASYAEAWRFGSARRQRPDGTESDDIWIRAPHPESKLIHPNLTAGRWLLPEDENAIVLSTYTLKDDADIAVGDEIVLDIEGDEMPWVVVGIVKDMPPAPFGFVNYPYFVRTVGGVGKAGVVFTQLADRPEDPRLRGVAQRALAKKLEAHLETTGMQVGQVQAQTVERETIESQFNILVAFLLIMAILLALVGGIGLMGMMSINVLERRREIGVMRALGASDSAVSRIVVTEGLVVGLISWGIGTVLALPLSVALSQAVGNSILRSPLNFVFSIWGMIIWFVTLVVLATVASLLPARRASRMTVREVLAYE